MKKILPFLRLGLFCFSLFAVAALGVMLKQKRLWAPDTKAKSGEHGEAESGANANESTKASLAGAETSGAGGASDASHDKGAKGDKATNPNEVARHEQAIAAGRTLFDVPQPISIAEASNLMNELKQQRKELEAKKAALEQKEKDLDAIEKEIEERRNDVIAKLGKLESATPGATSESSDDVLDPARVKQLGTLLALSAKNNPDAATRLIKAMKPEKAAVVLLKMDQKDAVTVFPLLPKDDLEKLMDALQHVKLPATEER